MIDEKWNGYVWLIFLHANLNDFNFILFSLIFIENKLYCNILLHLIVWNFNESYVKLSTFDSMCLLHGVHPLIPPKSNSYKLDIFGKICSFYSICQTINVFASQKSSCSCLFWWIDLLALTIFVRTYWIMHFNFDNS